MRATRLAPVFRVQVPNELRASQMLLRKDSFLQPLNGSCEKLWKESCHLGIPFFPELEIQWMGFRKTKIDTI